MRWIATNAGQEGSIVVQKVRAMKEEEGFNALNDTYENLLTTEALVCEIAEEKKAAPMRGGGGMGGMY